MNASKSNNIVLKQSLLSWRSRLCFLFSVKKSELIILFFMEES